MFYLLHIILTPLNFKISMFLRRQVLKLPITNKLSTYIESNENQTLYFPLIFRASIKSYLCKVNYISKVKNLIDKKFNSFKHFNLD